MTDDPPPWSSRSVLVSVSDLDRSADFYQTVMEVREIHRDGQIAVLRGDNSRPFTFYLRQALRGASRSGQDSLGVRSLAFDIGSIAALDRVEERLRETGAFRDRQSIPGREKFEMLRGNDPDRFPLSFVADESEREMSAADYDYVIALMYAIDVRREAANLADLTAAAVADPGHLDVIILNAPRPSELESRRGSLRAVARLEETSASAPIRMK